MSRIVIGIDTGGTFTDFVLLTDARLRVHKEPSTPEDPSAAILAGLRELGVDADEIVHGSTVATNALLERRGATTALVTTAGFEDVLAIGRQSRSAIYDLAVTRVPPLVPRALRFGATERLGPAGEVVASLEESEVTRIVAQVRQAGVNAIAVCLLHAYANPEHERRLVAALEAAFGGFVTASHQVVPEFREYERTSTTVANAYVGPVMDRYLGNLQEGLPDAAIRIMQSNGGSISIAAARRAAVRTVLSGPAGGVVGAAAVSAAAGFPDIITFDMGGTSTDVSLCRGEPGRTAEASVGGLPIRLPVLDIHTVGAGGGSIAYRDPGGALKVGPRSAGAAPGPVCYGGGGTEVTVTDANLLLGRLSADHFLGGRQRLQRAPVAEAAERLAREMSMSPTELAEGIVRVANTTMAGAIRVISVERGFDPRDFGLVSFGGAGAMHAAALAADLGIGRVIVPAEAGTLSALGMLLADIVRDGSQTLLQLSDEVSEAQLEAAFRDLEERARAELGADGMPLDGLRFERSADLRYVGQGYELEVPMQPRLSAAFHLLHQQRYGYSDEARPTEIVNLRVRAVAPIEKPVLRARPLEDADPSAAIVGDQELVFEGEARRAPIVDRERLRPGNVLTGPALVVEYSTTTVVPPEVACRVDGYANLILEPRR